jgi:hypothetical protein
MGKLVRKEVVEITAKEILSYSDDSGEKTDLWLPRALVRKLLGDKWPEFHSFCFEAVDCFKLEDGVLIPYDGIDGEPVPGPNFKLVMIDDVFP